MEHGDERGHRRSDLRIADGRHLWVAVAEVITRIPANKNSCIQTELCYIARSVMWGSLPSSRHRKGWLRRR